MLQIQIKKTTEASILSCLRPNGTGTYTKLHPNLEIHDIAHFVVEKQLGFKHAFYGLLLDGYDISDFAKPKEQRPEALIPKNLAEEALVTEHLVNLLQIAYQSKDYLPVIPSLKPILKEHNLNFPKALTEHKLKSIQDELTELMLKWKNLKEGESLNLKFK